MPYYHCRKCMHEFEISKGEMPVCDWCGTARPIMLEAETPLEKMLKSDSIENLLRKLNESCNSR